MDVKKYLRQRAEEDAASVLSESEKEYCRAIALEGEAVKRQSFNKRLWVPFICAVCVLLGAIIAISIIFTRKPTVMYFEDKIVSRVSQVEELRSNVKYFSFNEVENSSSFVTLNYDSESGDKLYYEVSVKGFFETAVFSFVTNKNYSYPFEDKSGKLTTKQLSKYSINFFMQESVTGIEYSGWIKYKTETVYISYTPRAVDDEAFFNFVEKLIEVK